jgi:tetratricopeptide (TPR) repeat protein
LREAARYCIENDLDRAIRIGVAYGNYWSNRSLIKEALKFYSKIFELADPESGEPDLARASFRQMQLLYISHAYASSDEGMAVATRTATLCQRAGLEAELALCQMAQARTYAGDIDRGIELIEASEKRLRELGETADLAAAIQSKATLQYYQGNLKGALETMEEAAALLGGAVYPFHQVQNSMMLAFMYFEIGDVAKAKVQAHKALGLADSYDFTQFVPMIQEVCGKVAQAEGDLGAAEEWYRASASNWDFLGSVYQHADLLHSLARVHLEKGEPAEALPLLATATSIWNSKGMTSVTPCCLVSAAKAYLHLGQQQLAGRLLGAYKGLTEPTRDGELPTEIAYVDSITRDLEGALGAHELAKIFASAPSQEEALKEAFSSVLP